MTLNRSVRAEIVGQINDTMHPTTRVGLIPRTMVQSAIAESSINYSNTRLITGQSHISIL
jgi:hypothetical protein